MKDIEMMGTWGGSQKKIRLSAVLGAGAIMHVMVDNFYHGCFALVNGKWVVHLNAKSDLCSNDITIMAELLDLK